MENEVLRRAVHMCAPLFALAYLIPENIGPVPRYAVILAAWASFAAFEVYRIKRRIPVPGLRGHEYGRPSAAFWMCSAAAPLILFFPVGHALPLLAGLGFVDPLCGVLRKNGSVSYPALPMAVYFLIMAAFLSYLHGMTAGVIVTSMLTSVSAIAAEGIKSRTVNDDFLMLFVPMTVLWLAGLVLI
jgi:hypothetical protein